VNEVGKGVQLDFHDADQVDFKSCLPFSALSKRVYKGKDVKDDSRLGFDSPGPTEYTPEHSHTGHATLMHKHDCKQISFESCRPYSALYDIYMGKDMNDLNPHRQGTDSPGPKYNTYKVGDRILRHHIRATLAPLSY
jgi:hypothetical protein